MSNNDILKNIMSGSDYRNNNTTGQLSNILNSINSTLSKLGGGIKQIINNQCVINQKLDILSNKPSINNSYKPVRYLTPRQLYFMSKEGWTIEEMCLVSSYTIEEIEDKIKKYIKDNM